jgi:ferredoxin
MHARGGAPSPGRGSMSPRNDLRLRVDWIRCDGYGLCGDLLPELIELDEWRYPILPRGPIDRSLLNDVQRTIDCCPMRALALVEVQPDRRTA